MQAAPVYQTPPVVVQQGPTVVQTAPVVIDNTYVGGPGYNNGPGYGGYNGGYYNGGYNGGGYGRTVYYERGPEIPVSYSEYSPYGYGPRRLRRRLLRSGAGLCPAGLLRRILSPLLPASGGVRRRRIRNRTGNLRKAAVAEDSLRRTSPSRRPDRAAAFVLRPVWPGQGRPLRDRLCVSRRRTERLHWED